jgi:predicted secreted protein
MLLAGCEGALNLNEADPAKPLQIKPGTKLIFTYRLHVSVGFGADYQIANPAVLVLLKEDAKYLHPERMKPGWTGGDEAQAVFIFQAKATGETALTIRKLFRGKVEEVIKYKIVVE